MDKKELQQRLNQPYTTENWQEIVKFVFPKASLKSKPLVLSVLPKYKDIVETFNILGDVPLEGQKTLILLELKLKDKVNIIKNRVQLNEIVSSVIDTESANGVLSIFEKGTDDYRFSFVARSNEFSEDGDLVEKKTDAKRFTYVLGKNESCKTPANQFYELRKNKDNLIIDDVIKAFNITKLNGEFFDEYKAIYNNIVEFFTGKKLVKVGGKWEEKTTSKPNAQLTYIFKNNELEARNFVKMLLGRIVFLKFVQKKGWMGVPKTRTDWKEGNIRFLEETFENFKHKELFYSKFLSPLFFDALNNPNRKDDVFTLTDSKIPYLSGGLFDEDNLKTKEIIIPKKHFEDIFEFLDKYNFTIDENSDIDDKNEFSVDPEMLGHIFENLLEDNKDKGAFYTPKEIVRYMCQESLKEYLKTSLENNNQWPTDETEAKDFEQALHNFVTKKEAGGIIEAEETIARALKDVKICDPAIGSGAFPMGLLNEIFQLVHKLHEANKDKVERVWELNGWQPNLVKQNIIQNSIYGVDIEKGAVDVARLRFWLSLIVDEPEPKALPHLDYKIVVGNSLVSKLDETIIDIDWDLDEMQQGFFGSTLAQERTEILQKISDKQKAVFDPNSDEEKLSLEIRNLKIDLLCKQLELMINNQNIPKEPKIIDYQNKPKAKFVQDHAKYFETVGWQQQITKLQKLKNNPEATLHFFDWKLDFPEIMNVQVTDKVGFDIVIGNPPYGANLDNAEKNTLKLKYTYLHTRTIDTFNFFIGLGSQILISKGVLNYIIPSAYFFQVEFEKSRGYFMNNYLPKIFMNLGDNIFDAVVPSCIFSFKNSNRNEHIYFCESKNRKNGLIDFNSGFYISKTELLSFGNSTVPFNFENQNLLKKLLNVSTQILGDICNEVNSGITTGHKTAFIIDKKVAINNQLEEKNLYKTLEGRNLKQFKINYDNKVIIYTDKDFSSIENKNIIKYLETFKDELSLRSEVKQDIKKWYSLGRARGSNLLLPPKIMCRETGDSIISSFDDLGYYPMNTIICIKLMNDDHILHKSICCLLNSKLMNFLFKAISQEDGRTFAKVRPIILRKLPLPNNIYDNKNQLSEFYDHLSNSEGIEYENLFIKLNTLIYYMYELTYDEVLVVEPEFSERMSREEYEVLKVE